MNVKRTTVLNFLVLSVGWINSVGCTAPSVLFTRDAVPASHFLVGGGYRIDFVAPEPGVLYLVESSLRRMVETKTVDTGQRYNFSYRDVKDLPGLQKSNTKFQLFFIPHRNARFIPKEISRSASAGRSFATGQSPDNYD